MSITKDAILTALGDIPDPALRRELLSPGVIKEIAVSDDQIELTIAATPGKPLLQEAMREALVTAVRDVLASTENTVQRILVEFFEPDGDAPAAAPAAEDAPAQPATPQSQASPLPGVRHIVAVGAGKGGVGKSTVAVNLAVALARQGASVGLMDGDIYGPSLPTLLGLDALEPVVRGSSLEPFFVHGVKAITIGKLVPADKPLIWRGPMAHGAFNQLVEQTNWGELDYLIIDLPPGTGDVSLTMAQTLRLDGAVIVCTPQKLAQDDAVRAVNMFRQLGVEVIGVVENMSYFIGDDGKEYDLFGRGGAEQMSQRLGVPFLGAVPIHMELRRNSDQGDPTANFEGVESLRDELETLAERFKSEVEQAGSRRESAAPSLTIK